MQLTAGKDRPEATGGPNKFPVRSAAAGSRSNIPKDEGFADPYPFSLTFVHKVIIMGEKENDYASKINRM